MKYFVAVLIIVFSPVFEVKGMNDEKKYLDAEKLFSFLQSSNLENSKSREEAWERGEKEKYYFFFGKERAYIDILIYIANECYLED